jgi:hypothetical protein
MFTTVKVLSYPVLMAMLLASGGVLAEESSERLNRERIYSDAATEAARQGQGFYNVGQADPLRHRAETQLPEFASQSQYQHRVQQDKQAQHRHREQQGKQAQHGYQYREQSSGQHRHQSGSLSNRSGKGGKGGGARGR